ncbi:MAG: hypothetical protein MJ070_07265 [Lachnospiraceae bacterium]|nr:hypothetical protein [Lachnospiraceae bacterium]
MKKLISVLLTVMLIATLFAVNAAAWAEWEDPVENGWTRYSIFDETYVELIDRFGSYYPIPAYYENGQHDDYFQFWRDAVHLYEDRGLNVYNGAQIAITFSGTGIRLCTCYRNNGGFQVSDIVASLDGYDVTDQLTDLVAPTDNNTAHTPILTLTGLDEGEHVLTLTCLSTSYRYSVDYFELENFIPGDPETEPETLPETVPATEPANETEAKPETDAPQTDPSVTDEPAAEKKDNVPLALGIIAFCAVIIVLLVLLISKDRKRMM